MRIVAAGLVLSTLGSAPIPASAAPGPAQPPCPAEQLSCGKQKPVLSDGVRPFENEEMGLRATFPRGSLVCMSRSGDAPRGFYAWYGAADAGCAERGDRPDPYMGLSSSFNALEHATLREAAYDGCGALSADVERRLDGAHLSISGRPSLACEIPSQDGSVEIMVYALAGKPTFGNAPRVVYWATLGSRPERLDKDLAMFRTFLATARIGLPEAEAPQQ